MRTMKRLPLVLTLLASLVLALGPVSADNTTALITGGGWRLGNVAFPAFAGKPIREFTVNVWSTDSRRVIGFYRFGSIGGTTFSGPVTCAKVAGNRAVIGGPITITSDPGLAGKSFLVFLTDNGPHRFGQIGPDTLSQTYLLPDDVQPGGSLGPGLDIPTNFPARCPAADGTASSAADVNDMTGDIAIWSGN